MKKILFLLISLFLITNTYGNGVLDINRISASLNTKLEFPYEHAFDENPNTVWSFDGDFGWLAVELEEEAFIGHVEVSGTLGLSARMSVEFWQNGHWIRFAHKDIDSGLLSRYRIELASDEVKSRKLRFIFENHSDLDVEIENIAIFPQEDYDRLVLLKIGSIEENANGMTPLKGDYLIDENVYTSWSAHTGNRQPYILGTVEVLVHLEETAELHELRLYFEEQNFDVLEIDIIGDDGNETLVRHNRSNETGWVTFALDYPRHAESLALRLRAYGQELGSISALSLWGKSDAARRHYIFGQDFSAAEQGNLSETVIFYQQEDNESGEFYIDVFGSALSLSSMELNLKKLQALYQSSRYHLYSVTAQQLFDMENFITVNGTGRLDALRVYTRQKRGELDFRSPHAALANTRLEDPLEYAQEAIIELEGEKYLQGLQLFPDDGTSYKLFYHDGSDWLSLNTEAVYTDRLKVEGVLQLPAELRVFGDDTRNRAPRLELIYPKPYSTIGAVELLTGKLTIFVDNPETVVSLNGQTLSGSGHERIFRLFRLPKAENGVYELNIEAVDLEQRVTTLKHEFYTSEIFASQIQPAQRLSYTKADSFHFHGSLFMHQFEILCNDEIVRTSRAGFLHEADLEDGLNHFRFTIKGRRFGGTISVVDKYVYRSTADLLVSIHSHKDGQVCNAETAVLSGVIHGAGSVQLTINGIQVPVTQQRFESPAFVLKEGENTFAFNAFDEAGNTYEHSLTVFKDSQAPVLHWQTPKHSQWYGETSLLIAGHVEDQSAFSVFVDRKAVPIEDDQFSLSKLYADGSQTIELFVRDAAGNTVSENRTVHVDTTAPKPFVISLSAESWTNQEPLAFFETSDAGIGLSHYEASINSTDFQPVDSPYQLPELDDGEHTLFIRAIDKLGNSRLASVTVKMDKTPPEAATQVRGIPGSDTIRLAFNVSDEDVQAYRVYCQDQGLISQVLSYAESVFIDDSVQHLRPYVYGVVLIDRAGNESEIAWSDTVFAGVASANYDVEDGAVVEYEQASIVVAANALPQEVRKILINEVESEVLSNAAVNPLYSPIYHFAVIEEDEGQLHYRDHVEFENEFLAVIDYDESILPEGMPASKLAVYYYDNIWGLWKKVEKSAVDEDNARIYFMTNHFTDFSIQPTVVEDLSLEELRDVRYAPSSGRIGHQPLQVSVQGGSLSTDVSELILSGMGGFQFELKRTYSSVIARGDALGASMSASIGFNVANFVTGDSDVLDFSALASSVSAGLFANVSQWIEEYLKNAGDYSYSLGNGWRINLPYVKSANNAVLLRLPDGSIGDVRSMELIDMKNFLDDGIPRVEARFRQHEYQDYEFVVIFDPINLDYKNSLDATWNALIQLFQGEDVTSNPLQLQAFCYNRARLEMFDGREYTFNASGQMERLYDTASGYVLDAEYEGETRKLKQLVDNAGHTVSFEYSKSTAVLYPLISKILVDDGKGSREIVYETETKGFVPQLVRARDIEGRLYEYAYENQILFSGGGSVTVNLASLAAQLFPGTQVLSAILPEAVRLSAHVRAEMFGTLSTAKGPGVGHTRASYAQESLNYFDLSVSDYFFGAIPLAITGSVNVDKRVVVETLRKQYPNDTMQTSHYSYLFDTLQFLGVSRKNIVNTQTVVHDGRTKTTYSFEPIWKARVDWIQHLNNILSGVVNPANFFVSDAIYRIDNMMVNTEILVEADNTSLSHVLHEFDADSLKLHSRLEQRGNLRILEEYDYDSAGNTSYYSREETVHGRRTHVERESRYLHSSESAAYVETLNSLEQDRLSNVRRNLQNLIIYEKTRYSVPDKEAEETEKRYFYTEFGQLEEVEQIGDNESLSVLYSYDEKHNIVKYIDAEGHSIDYDWDYAGLPYHYSRSVWHHNVPVYNAQTGQIEVDSISQREHYDYWGNLVEQEDFNGNTSAYSYDSLGRLTQHSRYLDGQEYTRTIAYNDVLSADNTSFFDVEISKENGGYERYRYNWFFQLIELEKQIRDLDMESFEPLSSAQSAVTEIDYSPWGEIRSVTDANGHTLRYTWDVLGNMTSMQHADAALLHKDWDYATNTVFITDERNFETRELIDARGELLSRYYVHADLEEHVYFDGLGRQRKVIDRNTNVERFTYDSFGRLVEHGKGLDAFWTADGVTEVESRVRYEYNKNSQKTAQRQRGISGEIRHDFILDSLGRVSADIRYSEEKDSGYSVALSSMPSDAVVSSYGYDANGNTVYTKDAEGGVILREYNGLNRMISQTDQAGNRSEYVYDIEGQLIQLKDPRAFSSYYPDEYDYTMDIFYDDSKRLVGAVLPFDALNGKALIRFEYDLLGNLVAQYKPDGQVLLKEYNRRNLLIREEQRGEDGQSLRRYYDYDERGQLIEERDGLAKSIEYGYDQLGRLIRITDGEGNTQRFAYDGMGNMTQITDANNHSSYYSYNIFNQVTSHTDATAALVAYEIDILGQVRRFTDALHRSTHYSYNALGHKVQELSPYGVEKTMDYDRLGNIKEKRIANEYRKEYSYTANYLLQQLDMFQVHENQEVLQTQQVYNTWDEAGYLKLAIDNGIQTRYNHIDGQYISDPYGRVWTKETRIDGQSLKVDYSYDVMNRVRDITYPSGSKITQDYTSLGQLKHLTEHRPGENPKELTRNATYLANGLFHTVEALNAIRTKQSYDNANRLTGLVYTKHQESLHDYQFLYDGAHNIRQIQQPDAISHYDYNRRNELITVMEEGYFAIDVDAKEKALLWQQQIVHTDSDYYQQKTMELAEEDAELKLDYAAASIGVDLEAQVYVNRIQLNTSRLAHRLNMDKLSIHVSKVNAAGSFTRIDNWDYEETSEHSIVLRLEKPVQARYVKIHCVYDERDMDYRPVDAATFRNRAQKLITVYYMVPRRDENYSYDEVGNRRQSQSELLGLTDESWTRETKNYAYYENTNWLKTDGKYFYRYDIRGNLIARGTEVFNTYTEDLILVLNDSYREYEYDLLNRLVKVKTYNEESENMESLVSYAYDHRGYRIQRSANDSTTYYAFDETGKLLYEEIENSITEYIYWQDKHFAFRKDGELYFYQTNHLGTTTGIYDREGTLLWAEELTRFGEATGDTGLMDYAAKYTGKDLDADTGLYYFNARWYDAALGRFITEDPIKDGLNWYVYVGNNPLTRVDPSGLFSEVFYAGNGLVPVVKIDINPFRSDGSMDQKLFDRRYGLERNKYKGTVSCMIASIVNAYPEFKTGRAGLAELDAAVKKAGKEEVLKMGYEGGWAAGLSNQNRFSEIIAEAVDSPVYKELQRPVEKDVYTAAGYTEGLQHLRKTSSRTDKIYNHYVYDSKGQVVDSLDPLRHKTAHDQYDIYQMFPIENHPRERTPEQIKDEQKNESRNAFTFL